MGRRIPDRRAAVPRIHDVLGLPNLQGWTALSDMDHDQGVLHTVPIPEAMGYLMLRPLLDDVPEDDMCGVTTNQTFPASERWHSLLCGRRPESRTSRRETRSGGTAT